MRASQERHLLAELDLSQAESRIVDGASGVPAALELARTPPWELDQHALNASLIFGVDIAAVTRPQRDLGKRTRHAVNYGEGGSRMAEVALLETEGQLWLDADECEEWITELKGKKPEIARYHEWIVRMGTDEGRIRTSWGGPGLRTLTYRIDKKDYKEWFAFFAQQEVGKLLNQWGFLPARRFLRRTGSDAILVNQSHDSFMASGPPRALWDLWQHILPILSGPRTYPGAGGPWELRMPVGLKIGRDWGHMHEWKRPPGRGEFLDVAAALLKGG